MNTTTPRPWKYPFGGAIVTVAGGIYDKVTVVSGEMRPDDAALIVEAVNNYDGLREALGRALAEHEEMGLGFSSQCWCHLARAALGQSRD